MSKVAPFPLRVPYYVITDDQISEHWEMPFLFFFEWVELIRMLPQNVLQIVDHNAHVNLLTHYGHLDGYDITLLNEMNLSQLAGKHIIDFGVIFIATRRRENLHNIKEVFKNFIIISMGEDGKELVQSVEEISSELQTDVPTILTKISIGMASEIMKFDKLFESEFIQKLSEKLLSFAPATILKQPKKYLFRSTNANYAITNLINADAWKVQAVVEKPSPLSNRSKLIIETAKALDVAYTQYLYNTLPPIIVIVPFSDPKYLKVIKKLLVDAPVELRSDLGKVVELFKIEEHKENYGFHLIKTDGPELSEKEKEFAKAYMVTMGAKNAARSVIIDILAFLHASFQYCPSVRLPLTGKSLNSSLSFFDMKKVETLENTKNVFEKIQQVGMDLREAYPPGFREYILEQDRQIVFISDLPCEWMDADGIPLGFLHDVCRVPETPHVMAATQALNISKVKFTIGKDFIKKTLVVCTCPEDENMYRAFESIKDTLNSQNVAAKFTYASELKEIRALIVREQPEFIIYYGHGVFREKESDTALQVGHDLMTIDEIMKGGLTAPIMWLFACNTAPLNGYPNSVAQAFFAEGAFSVVSSFAPISIKNASILCTRMLGLLSECLDVYKSANWLEFTQHFIRTSFVSDSIQRILEANSIKNKVTIKDLNWAPYYKWYDEVQNFELRRACYEKIPDVIVEVFPEQMREKVQDLLRIIPPPVEYLYYTHLGRPDLIQFDVAIEYRQDLMEKISKKLEEGKAPIG
jgi:hypothetical protein